MPPMIGNGTIFLLTTFTIPIIESTTRPTQTKPSNGNSKKPNPDVTIAINPTTQYRTDNAISATNKVRPCLAWYCANSESLAASNGIKHNMPR